MLQNKARMVASRHLGFLKKTENFKSFLNSRFVPSLEAKCGLVISNDSKVTGIERSRSGEKKCCQGTRDIGTKIMPGRPGLKGFKIIIIVHTHPNSSYESYKIDS